jgi:hypothetical protein
MLEKPLERLNYYNGMAVDAAGFKTEQDYHIRVRRWLNKSLYSAGIASGLEVRAAAMGPNVIVSPGLALDSIGREIILLEETIVEVCSYSGTNASTVVGNYLVIEYSEEAVAYESGSCAVRTPVSRSTKSSSNWGGPSRVQATPKFSWVAFVPPPGANQIVLARVELRPKTCDAVEQIDTGTRRYVGAASAAKVRQYALEGEREVVFIPKEAFPTLAAPAPQPTDVEVVGRIYFHIRGRQPNAVTLYLRAEKFSPLHYTEMGLHQHSLTVTQNVITSTPIRYPDANPDKYKHRHIIAQHRTLNDGADGTHENHGFRSRFAGSTPNAFQLSGITIPLPTGNIVISDPGARGDLLAATSDSTPGHEVTSTITAGAHYHSISQMETNFEFPFADDDHKHTLSPSVSMAEAGVSDLAREGDPLEFVDNLQIFVGPVENTINRTVDIRQQLADANPTEWKDSTGGPKGLGDGSKNHVLAMSGTGTIRLDFLPNLSFSEGEYAIEFKLTANPDSTDKMLANGGRIHYCLYVE